MPVAPVRLSAGSLDSDRLPAMSPSDADASPPNEIERAADAGAGIPGLPPDWPQQATSRVVDVIDKVRVKTTGPAIGISRTVVYGLILALLAPIALTLLVVATVRGLNELLPGQVGPIYIVMGALFTAAGLVIWSRRPRGAAG